MSTKTNTRLMLLLLLIIIITAATIIITNKSGHFGFYKMKSIEQCFFFFILNLFHSSTVTKLAFVGYMSKVDALLKQSYIFF